MSVWSKTRRCQGREAQSPHMAVRLAKPAWIPEHMPALDGLRGVAIFLVLLHHCAPRLVRLGLGGVAAWGWSGVDLFFVLSGFLITGIILDGRGERRFFRNFYARRGLRILPLYALVVPLNYWLCGRANTWTGGGVWWLYFLLFAQNLVPGLSGTLYPAWSLAIEEQFYLCWAPLARWLPTAGLGSVLAAVLAVEPWVRAHAPGLTAVHTLYHLDGLAAGAALALGLRRFGRSFEVWRGAGIAGTAVGLAGVVWAAHGHGAWIDSFLAVGFASVLLLAAMDASRVVCRPLKWSGLRWLGRISYSLYLTHMMVFALLGGVDAHLDRVGAGAAGDAGIVLLRWAVSIAVAAGLWYGFERPILRLKRRFTPVAQATRVAA